MESEEIERIYRVRWGGKIVWPDRALKKALAEHFPGATTAVEALRQLMAKRNPRKPENTTNVVTAAQAPIKGAVLDEPF